MTEVVSKIRKIERNDQEIYQYLSDFRNLDSIIPEDKIKNWTSEEETCQFTIDGVGKAGMRIVEKEPYKLIKISSYKETPFEFNFWLQLKQVEEQDTRIRLTLRAKLNPIMKAMVSGQLQKGMDAIVDKLADFFNEKKDLQG